MSEQMKVKDHWIFLILQLFGIGFAGVVFSQVPSKKLAGLLAGSYFLGSGLYMLLRAWRWPKRWSSALVYFLFFQVFVFSLPMIAIRLLNPDLEFNQIEILGLTGPQFHQLSTANYFFAMAANAFGLVKITLKAKKKSS